MNSTRRAIIVVGLAYGDCGKGTIVDFLARTQGPRTVVRFNGGPQAGHNVVADDGRQHTFSQFGSGSFVPAVRTLLSRFMLIEPYALLNEAAHLQEIGIRNALARLCIDRRCPVITPLHQAANRLSEIAMGDAAPGTCGLGIGQTARDLLEHPQIMLHAGDLKDRATVKKQLLAARDLKMEQLRDTMAAARSDSRACASVRTIEDVSWIDAAIDNYTFVASNAQIVNEREADEIIRDGVTLFEGAQGVLLDESYGFHPHTTWSDTTFNNANALLNDAGHDGDRTRLGVLRTYFTRHGRGPLVGEDATLRSALPEPHNDDAGWQGPFRMAAFDTLAARYALAAAGGVDALAITHLDRLNTLPPCFIGGYSCDGADEECFVCKDGRIVDLCKPVGIDLDYMARLTRTLRKCRPAYTPLPRRDEETFLQTMEQELGATVAITSHSPTAAGKQWRSRIGRPDSAT